MTDEFRINATSSIIGVFKRRPRSIIDFLRIRYLGNWSYDHRRCSPWMSETHKAHAESHYAPQYDGDDDTFVTVVRVTLLEENMFGGESYSWPCLFVFGSGR